MISPTLSDDDILLGLVTKGKQSALSKIAVRMLGELGLTSR
jgi:nitrogen PTS system EIIA component